MVVKLRPDLSDEQKGKALEGLGCSVNTVPPDPLEFDQDDGGEEEQSADHDDDDGGANEDEDEEDEHARALRYLRRIGEDRGYNLMVEAFPNIERARGAGTSGREGDDNHNNQEDSGDENQDQSDANEESENTGENEDDTQGNNGNDGTGTQEDQEENGDEGNGDTNSNHEDNENNDSNANNNEGADTEEEEEDQSLSHRGGPNSPKHKKHKSGARPKKKRRQEQETLTETGDTEGNRALESIKVTPENPVHLCPVRDKRGCRFGICHGCFMSGIENRSSKRKRRGRPKGNMCQHDDLDGLTCFGERNYFCKRYFEGPSEGGNYPNRCCKCKVSLLGWR